MDVSVLIKQRLLERGLDQKELAGAANVTESYISQLLAGKKIPPSPARTDIYEKIGAFLGFAGGELPRLAELQRRHELKRKIADPTRPLLQDCRKLILSKCSASNRNAVQRIFEKEAFGELERLVTQQILAVVQAVVRENSQNGQWIKSLSQMSGHDSSAIRDAAREFTEADVFHITGEWCSAFLDPILESWNIDLRSFGMQVSLSSKMASGVSKRFEYLEQVEPRPIAIERGLEQFLADKSMCGDATDEEIRLLSMLRFAGRRPTALYYYRELQSLRDPLHFLT